MQLPAFSGFKLESKMRIVFATVL